MIIEIPYGRTGLSIKLPENRPVDIIKAPFVSPAENPVSKVQNALENLLGEKGWDSFESSSVAIAINDKTRPVPHKHLLPPLLEKLDNLGIPDQAITLFIAVGTHPPMEAGEFAAVLSGEIIQRYRIVSHDSENEGLLLDLGKTSRGTRVFVNRAFVQADLKIVVGNIEPHQFVGFSGGVKSAAIGLAGMKTIKQNHTLMTHPAAELGEYINNPARSDIEEIGKIIGVDLALNAIMNQEKKIVSVLAGDPVAVMQEGIQYSRKISQVPVSEKYSFIIASPGGHPKDINVYQAQKGLAHAARICRDGGTLLLAAACPEGAGSPHYESWMDGKHTYQDVIEAFEAGGFEIGPHKAFQIARDATRVQFGLYSDLPVSTSRKLLLNPIRDFQAAVDVCIANMQPDARIGIMTHAASTLPYIEIGKEVI